MPLTTAGADELIAAVKKHTISETEDEYAEPEQPGVDWGKLEGQKMGQCPVDGEDAWHNTGTSKKNGEPYENLKCTKNEKHIYWRVLKK